MFIKPLIMKTVMANFAIGVGHIRQQYIIKAKAEKFAIEKLAPSSSVVPIEPETRRLSCTRRASGYYKKTQCAINSTETVVDEISVSRNWLNNHGPNASSLIN